MQPPSDTRPLSVLVGKTIQKIEWNEDGGHPALQVNFTDGTLLIWSGLSSVEACAWFDGTQLVALYPDATLQAQKKT